MLILDDNLFKQINYHIVTMLIFGEHLGWYPENQHFHSI